MLGGRSIAASAGRVASCTHGGRRRGWQAWRRARGVIRAERITGTGHVREPSFSIIAPNGGMAHLTVLNVATDLHGVASSSTKSRTLVANASRSDREAGRTASAPIDPQVDHVGTVVLPLSLVFAGAPDRWAKPVPASRSGCAIRAHMMLRLGKGGNDCFCLFPSWMALMSAEGRASRWARLLAANPVNFPPSNLPGGVNLRQPALTAPCGRSRCHDLALQWAGSGGSASALIFLLLVLPGCAGAICERCRSARPFLIGPMPNFAGLINWRSRRSARLMGQRQETKKEEAAMVHGT